MVVEKSEAADVYNVVAWIFNNRSRLLVVAGKLKYIQSIIC